MRCYIRRLAHRYYPDARLNRNAIGIITMLKTNVIKKLSNAVVVS